jgi:hypothetical protein
VSATSYADRLANAAGVSRDTSPLAEIREIDRMATLAYIAEGGQEGRRVSYCMPNARTLLAHGLIEKRRTRHSSWYVVTDAGRTTIAKAEGRT